ncbi:MAG: DegT/DnrJ/EryC1/StrS family aminotransferase, partial [Puniceicoccales bacterium]|nr:DegT/DnrJ/EryC1/StrS family aminotransferase [Puniceicoccales bacterium]
MEQKKKNIPFFKPSITLAEREAIGRVLDSGWLTTGEYVEKFETEFCRLCGAKYGIALNSATAALHLSIESSKIPPKEAVLVPTMTFASTAEILYYRGIEPILVDCRDSDLLISEEDTRRKLHKAINSGKKVTGIIPVHYGGKMVDMDWVDNLSKEFCLKVIEDAAHCCGSKYFSKKHNQWKSMGESTISQCYSFYCTKCITTAGEGGMVITNSEELAHQVRILSLHGLSSNAWKRFLPDSEIFYDIICPGYKYNLTDIGAAMGIEQLRRNGELRQQKESITKIYRNHLKNIPFVYPLEEEADHYYHSHHLFVVKIDVDSLTVTRNDIIHHLNQKGITCSVHWKPLHMYSFYRNQGFKNEDYPVATKMFDQIISLPLYP